jgi:hypothetical protein
VGRAAAGAVLGAALVAGLSEDRRRWARGSARRVARRCGAFGDTRVATKLLLKKAAGCLDANGVPFLLAGGGACWAYGGPFPKDFDLFVAPSDAGRATTALEAGGFRIVRRPEEWLFQAYEHGLKIDVVFEPAGLELRSDVFARAARLGVDGVEMRVLRLEDVFVTRLLAVTDDTLSRFERLIEAARALREQVDWDEVEARTTASPYARSFLTLLRALGVTPPSASASMHDGLCTLPYAPRRGVPTPQ